MSAKKLPPLDQLLAHRRDGLTDTQIADLYGAQQNTVSGVFRRAGHGRGHHTRPLVAPPPTPTARVNVAYLEPDLTGLCAARELLGTRVCDKHPHGRTTAHEGEGPRDQRAEFWATQ